ncbi:Metalloprotease [Aspergillus candidus]|uniref:Neutral protease 2 n=1 Tax=Aspergillus candidus TaxID=41067 RepID=A0A2I2FAK9_ASPCN|nr:Metalloprotease [Aspergillus candidus]PLB37654.1 Metalloprotease [Aspergillus candidus]
MQFTFALFAAAALLTPVYSNAIPPMIRRESDLKIESCTTSQQAVVEAAVQRAASVAKAAADAAVNGDANIFEEFFRTTDTASRQDVAARFEAIANEASNFGSGNVTFNCGNDEKQGVCRKGVLAYALSGSNKVVTCPDWYKIVAATDNCGGTDQGTAMVHELSHLSVVYSPGTGDFAYKYNDLVQLSADKAVLNADTYSLYASAIELDCQKGESKGVELPDWMIDEIANGKQ